jgi:hypothetical protein
MFAFLPSGSSYDTCPTGTVWSDLSQDCVISVDVGGNGSGLPGTDSNIMLYLGLGLAALLLLSFAGGRASKKTSSGSRLVSRTTTRSLFA